MKLMPVIIVMAVLGVVMTRKVADGTLPKGIRNKNPLNMRDYGIQWQGRVGKDADGFTVFDKPENGIRAAGNDMKNKWLRGITTINKLVSAWAPTKGIDQSGREYENPTAQYVQFVSNRAGIAPDAELLNIDEYTDVVMAMIQKENGQNPYSRNFVRQHLLSGFTSGAGLPFYFDLVSYA